MNDSADFQDFRPTELIVGEDIEPILALIAKLRPGLEFEAEGLDFVLRHRVLRAIRLARSGSDAIASLTKLATALRRAAAMHDTRLLDGFKIPCASRWRAYAVLLDAQADSLEATSTEALRRLEHVDPILDALVNHGPFPAQDDLLAVVQKRSPTLQKASLSRLLTRLEEAGYVIRRRVGQRQEIHVGPECPEADFRRDRGLKFQFPFPGVTQRFDAPPTIDTGSETPAPTSDLAARVDSEWVRRSEAIAELKKFYESCISSLSQPAAPVVAVMGTSNYARRTRGPAKRKPVQIDRDDRQ